jgi:hypothetical protein
VADLRFDRAQRAPARDRHNPLSRPHSLSFTATNNPFASLVALSGYRAYNSAQMYTIRNAFYSTGQQDIRWADPLVT